jgi:hypothetical protein
MLARPQPAVFSVQTVRGDGYAEGIADTVLLSIAVYEAAVFPLIHDGVSDEEQEARRAVAYRLSAYDGLPRSVRVSAAAALEALDDGLDTERARSAVKELSLAVYDCRGRRSILRPAPGGFTQGSPRPGEAALDARRSAREVLSFRCPGCWRGRCRPARCPWLCARWSTGRGSRALPAPWRGRRPPQDP